MRGQSLDVALSSQQIRGFWPTWPTFAFLRLVCVPIDQSEFGSLPTEDNWHALPLELKISHCISAVEQKIRRHKGGGIVNVDCNKDLTSVWEHGCSCTKL